MKPYLKICLIALPTLMAGSPALGVQTDREGTEPSQPAAHNHRGAKQLMLENGEGALIRLWKPDLTHERLRPVHGALTLPRTGMDNYHALVVEKDWGDRKETVIRYEYMFGPPSKRSPGELAGVQKSELEIVPAPIPREHFRYLSGQTWGFQVRLQGLPAAQLSLTLETENGTRLQALSDASGYASFRLPDDFPDVVEGQRDRRSAEFTITTRAEDQGIDYETQLSASYWLSPSHWQSTPMGLAVLGLGFVVGGLIGRPRDKGGKKA